MKTRNILLAVVALALMMTACEEKTKASLKDRSTGNMTEVLIITQNNDQWDGIIGDSIRHFFLDYQYGLPQPEAQNELVHIKTKDFSDLFHKHKCILEVVIDPSVEKAVAETSVDAWAAPQRYVKITAPNSYEWVDLFEAQKDLYHKWFNKVERDRILNVLRPTIDKNIGDAIAKKFGFTLTIPQGFYIGKNEPDFMWIRKETDRASSCILVYSIPYQDTAQFNRESLIAMRNMMVGKYIPGPSEGSYMSTETEFVPPLVSYVADYPAGYTMEMRGMWRVEGDFMGGPFVSYTFADSRTGNLVTVEGYYYEPNQKKRNALLQLEAVAYSLKFVEE